MSGQRVGEVAQQVVGGGDGVHFIRRHHVFQNGHAFRHGGMLLKGGEERLVHQRLYPGEGLVPPAVVPEAGFLHAVPEAEERFFNGVQPAPFQGGAGEDGGRPAGRGALQVVEHHFQFLAVGGGALAVVAVVLRDDEDVRQFHDAALDALQVVPGPRDEQEHEDVHHGAHRGFRLAHADGFNEDDIEARGFARDHGFTRFPGHAAQGASGRGRADEGVFFPGELFHTGFVPHDGTSGDGGGGVDGKDGHFEAFSAQVGAEGLDEGGFARSRNARDADPDGIAGVGKELGDEFPGGFLVPGGVAFYQGDGPAQQGSVSGDDPLDEFFYGGAVGAYYFDAAHEKGIRSVYLKGGSFSFVRSRS